MTYENELNKIAYTNVGSITYPTPTATIEDQIVAKNEQITDLINERVKRPSPKSAYVALLGQYLSELAALLAQNDQIIADNAAARTQAETDYQAAITAEKEKADVIAAAEAAWAILDYNSRVTTVEETLAELFGV